MVDLVRGDQTRHEQARLAPWNLLPEIGPAHAGRFVNRRTPRKHHDQHEDRTDTMGKPNVHEWIHRSPGIRSLSKLPEIYEKPTCGFHGPGWPGWGWVPDWWVPRSPLDGWHLSPLSGHHYVPIARIAHIEAVVEKFNPAPQRVHGLNHQLVARHREPTMGATYHLMTLGRDDSHDVMN